MQLSLIDGSKVWFGSDSTSVPICSQWVQGWLDVDVGQAGHRHMEGCPTVPIICFRWVRSQVECAGCSASASKPLCFIFIYGTTISPHSLWPMSQKKPDFLEINFHQIQLTGDFAENKPFMTNTLLELLSSEIPKYLIWEHPLVCLHRLWAFGQYLLYAVSFWDISLVTALNTSQMTAPNIWTHCNITFYPTVIVT